MTGELYLATSPSGKRYVGITTQGIAVRWRQHVSSALRGVRSRLNSAIKHYGGDSFRLEVIGAGTWEELNRMEPETVARLGTLWPKGYNLRAGGSQSSPHPESMQKLSKSLSGRTLSPEHRSRVRASQKLAMKAARQSNLGAKRSNETRNKIREAALKRRHSPETRAKISASLLGRVK